MRFRFALISDVHFGERTLHAGKLRKLGDQAEGLTRAFTREMSGGAAPDVIVNLGDVVEDADAETDRAHYRRFVDILGEAPCPVIHVAGNHESVNLSDEELGHLWQHAGPLYYTRDIGPVTFVILRTVQHARSIELPPDQIDWLDGVLAAARRPVVLLMHHPLSDQDLTGNPWFEKNPSLCRVANRRAVRDVVSRAGNVVAVFNGHVHWNHLDVIDGVPYVTVQSLTENVDDDAPGRAARAFAEVTLERQRMVVVVRGEAPVRYQFELPNPVDAWPRAAS